MSEESKPKRVFKPTIPQRRIRPVVSQDSLLATLPGSSAADSKRKKYDVKSEPGFKKSTQNRNSRFNANNPPNASGPFSMGSSLNNSRGGGNHLMTVKADAQEYADTEHLDANYVDMHSVLGNAEHDPVLFQLKHESKDAVCADMHESKNLIDPCGTSILNIDESMLHLLQLPPILPVIDDTSLPVWVEEPNTRGELRGPDSWVEPADPDDKTIRVRKKEGRIGQFLVRKSGKVQLQINDQLFDVTMAPAVSFHQQVVVIDPKMNQGFGLGEVASQYICSPNLDTLLCNRENEILKSM